MNIIYQGTFFKYHSLSTINRELAIRLAKEHTLSLEPYESDDFDSDTEPRFRELDRLYWKTIEPVDVTIRHRYPPDLSAVPEGKLIVMQPWEFWAFPLEWVNAINRRVNVLVAPSQFCYDSYVASGILPEKLALIPYGINPTYGPAGETYPLPDEYKDHFKFGFVGGCIQRKGWDVALKAFQAAFNKDDPVVLVVKDSPFYTGSNIPKHVFAGGPPVHYLRENLETDQLASLYRTLDCGVFPHRGEGLSLVPMEALICGTPSIITNWSGSTDWATAENSFLLDYQVVDFPQYMIENNVTRVKPRLAEPDFDHLVDLYRRVFNHREDLTAKAEQGKALKQEYTWEQATVQLINLLDHIPENDSVIISADTLMRANRHEAAVKTVKAHPAKECFALEFFHLWNKTHIIQALDWSLQCDPDFAPALFVQGQIHLQNEDVRSALTCFQKATERDGTHPFQWLQLATCYQKTSQLVRAKDALLKALELDPTSLEALESLRQLHYIGDPQVDRILKEKVSTERQTISLCCITRDEVDHLRNALRSTQGLGDETIIVHTSPYRSEEMQQMLKEFPHTRYLHLDDWWDPSRNSISDFSAARNTYIREASGDFVVWFDCISGQRYIPVRLPEGHVTVMKIADLWDRHADRVVLRPDGKEELILEGLGYQTVTPVGKEPDLSYDYDTNNILHVSDEFLTMIEDRLPPGVATAIRTHRFNSLKDLTDHLGLKNRRNFLEKLRHVLEYAWPVYNRYLTGAWVPLRALVRAATDKKLVRVRQGYGETVVTEDHRLATYTAEGWMEHPIQEENRPLAAVRSLPPETPVAVLDLHNFLSGEADEQWVQLKQPYVPGSRIHRYLSGEDLQDLCYAIGVYLANGEISNYTKRYNFIRLHGFDQDMLKQVEMTLVRLVEDSEFHLILGQGNWAHPGRGRQASILESRSHALRMLFRELCGTEEKKLPLFFYHLPVKCQNILVQGILDGSPKENLTQLGQEERIPVDFELRVQDHSLLCGLSLWLTLRGLRHRVKEPQKSDKTYHLIYHTRLELSHIIFHTEQADQPPEDYVYDVVLGEGGNHYFVDAHGQVLVHNCDELWEPRHKALIPQIIRNPDLDGLLLPVICPQRDEHGREHESLTQHIKVFRNRRIDPEGIKYRSPREYAETHHCTLDEAVQQTLPLYGFREPIHEQIAVSIDEQGGKVTGIDIPIRHVGYLASNVTMEEKYIRNLSYCQEKSQEDPTSDWWRFNEMTTLLLMGELEQARQAGEIGYQYLHFEQAHAGKYVSTLATIHMGLGDWRKGLEYCQVGIDRKLNECEAYFNAGACYRNLGNVEKAEEMWLAAIESGRHIESMFSMDLGAANFKPYLNLSEIYRERGDLVRAKNFLLKALSYRPDDTAARQRMTEYYHQLGQVGRAREQERWLRDNLQTLIWKGYNALQDQCSRTAIRLLAEASQRTKSPDIYNGLALALDQIEEDPLPSWNEALKLDPTHKPSLQNMIVYLRQHGKWGDLLAVVERYLHAYVTDPYGYYRLGELLDDLKLDEKAIRSYTSATAVDPSDGQSWYKMGLCAHRLGRLGQAYSCLERAHYLLPGQPEITLAYRDIDLCAYGGNVVDPALNILTK